MIFLCYNHVDMFNPFDTTDEKIRRVGWSHGEKKKSNVQRNAPEEFNFVSHRIV